MKNFPLQEDAAEDLPGYHPNGAAGFYPPPSLSPQDMAAAESDRWWRPARSAPLPTQSGHPNSQNPFRYTCRRVRMREGDQN